MKVLLSKVDTTYKLSEPDSFIFIATEKDEGATIKEHERFILKLAEETNYGEEITAYNKYSDGSYDVIILKTVDRNVQMNVYDIHGQEEVIETGNISNSTENNLANNFNENTSYHAFDIPTSILLNETEDTREQNIQIENDNSKKVPSQTSNNYLIGEQYKSKSFGEPIIYINGENYPRFLNSLTGIVRETNYVNLKLFTGENRIPDDTKMLIVDKGNSKVYYKNITANSKVWFLDEKVFYPCIVQTLYRDQSKYTLRCIDHTPAIVSKVEWDNIFPIESTDLIKDMGEFAIQPDDIDWDSTGTPKRIRKTKHEEHGEQYLNNSSSSPLIFQRIIAKNKWLLIDSGSGEFRLSSPAYLTKVPEDDPIRIPNNTKMTADKKFKIILPKSKVIYHWKEESVLIRGAVHFFSMKTPKPTIRCINGRDFSGVDWEDIFPIDSYELIKDLAPRWKPEPPKLKRKRNKISKQEDSKKNSATSQKQPRYDYDDSE